MTYLEIYFNRTGNTVILKTILNQPIHQRFLVGIYISRDHRLDCDSLLHVQDGSYLIWQTTS